MVYELYKIFILIAHGQRLLASGPTLLAVESQVEHVIWFTQVRHCARHTGVHTTAPVSAHANLIELKNIIYNYQFFFTIGGVTWTGKIRRSRIINAMGSNKVYCVTRSTSTCFSILAS